MSQRGGGSPGGDGGDKRLGPYRSSGAGFGGRATWLGTASLGRARWRRALIPARTGTSPGAGLGESPAGCGSLGLRALPRACHPPGAPGPAPALPRPRAPGVRVAEAAAGPRRSPPARDAARLGFANGAGARNGAPLTFPARGSEGPAPGGGVSPPSTETNPDSERSRGRGHQRELRTHSSPDSFVTRDSLGFPRNSASLVRGSLPPGVGYQAQLSKLFQPQENLSY